MTKECLAGFTAFTLWSEISDLETIQPQTAATEYISTYSASKKQ
jgi:hypothetical protein